MGTLELPARFTYIKRVAKLLLPPTDHRGNALWGFVFYVAGGALLLLFLANYFNPGMSNTLEEACRTVEIKQGQSITPEQYEKLPFELIATCKSFKPSKYPAGGWIYLVAVEILAATAYYPRLLDLLRYGGLGPAPKNVPAIRGLMVSGLFIAVGGLVAFLYFKEPGLWLWWGLYGALFGVVENVAASKLDFSFLDSEAYSETVKVNILRDEHDRWTWGFSLFSALMVSIGIAAALSFVFAANPLVRDQLLQLYLGLFGYGAIGIALVYGDVIQKVNTIGEKYRKLTRGTLVSG